MKTNKLYFLVLSFLLLSCRVFNNGDSSKLIEKGDSVFLKSNNCFKEYKQIFGDSTIHIDVYYENSDSSKSEFPRIIQEKVYYPNGLKKSLTLKTENSNYSVYTEWDNEGFLKCTGNLGIDKGVNISISLIDTSYVYVVSVPKRSLIKNGRWVYYNKDGSIKNVEYYNNGIKVNIK